MQKKTLVIANPQAASGKAKLIFNEMKAGLEKAGLSSLVQLQETCYPRHAVILASESSAYDRVISLGGDGLINEIVSGLMTIHEDERPDFGVIPCGNGNDFARSLNQKPGNALKIVRDLMNAPVKFFDLGQINGQYFIETVSFGLDAAIATGTHERRERTGKTGTSLFLEEGLYQLKNHRELYHMKLSLAGQEALELPIHLAAVQLGPTYGGGFKICPDANHTDHRFRICAALGPLNFMAAIKVFLKAKDGRHVKDKKVFRFYEADRLIVDFDREVPAQFDGEELVGRHFEVCLIPAALRVICPNPHFS